MSPLEALYRLEQLERMDAASRKRPDVAATAAAGGTEAKLRVLIADDSSLMQKVLARVYESAGDIEVVGVAADGKQALDLISRLKPDLVSLDLYMPVMDGVATLKHIMVTHPTPTVVVTSASPEDLDLTFESILRFGAIDFIAKPSRSRGGMERQVDDILRRLRKAARVKMRGLRFLQPPPRPMRVHSSPGQCQALIASVAGTGACLSYSQLLTSLAPDLPVGIIGLLPFPEPFLQAFVAYLQKCSAFRVEIARDGLPLQGGTCYLAGLHSAVTLEPRPDGPILRIASDPREDAAAALMLEVARHYGSRSIGLLLAGDGDGAMAGLAGIRAAGGMTMAQLAASCVDPEQSCRACELDLVDRVVLLPYLSSELSQFLVSRSTGAQARAAS
jgi:two-component system chemotaxis response regulator CheB